ncbi:PAS domain-containing sensor histidine kinase [Gemmata sp. G18]|uniref:histidine kinase n=1 Tax=Gemmata palustris TaxID=2822762 RepID=A0ABS5BSK4_9BACT|nr:ATP-binding protein [Gemmata palustris]MBP3956722.1 PAS domain-containing sensor histidine kinase [Gemmata palustris]
MDNKTMALERLADTKDALKSSQKCEDPEQKSRELLHSSEAARQLTLAAISERVESLKQEAHDLAAAVESTRLDTKSQSDRNTAALEQKARDLAEYVENLRVRTRLLSDTKIAELGHSEQATSRLNEELERRVTERTVQLEAANRELEAFCFSVSHDLRAPLRALDGFSQELLQGYSDRLDETGQHYLRRVRAGTQRMGQLIDDLLKLSRVTRSEMRHERVDLTAMAGDVVAELREREPGRSISFTARPGLSAVGDPPLIRVVLDNLLGNAWKFTAKNPTATIAFDCVEVQGRPALVVRDDGAGFDMAFVGKLFGAFQRLHSDRDFSGTGVGLATVQRAVRRHGGEIWAEGAIGHGAAFFFTLPGIEDLT